MHLQGLFAKQLAVMLLEFLRLRWIEGEIRQIFGCLDVVLVTVGPVEIYLAPIVRHSVRGGLAIGFTREIAAGHKIAAVIVALKKAVEMVVNVAFIAAAVLR